MQGQSRETIQTHVLSRKRAIEYWQVRDETAEARDGREGLTLYQQNKVDLVLMDILMPGTDGLEATLQLTKEYLDAKVIAMTGAQGDKNFLDVAKLFGARRVFEKPFDLDKLVQAINEELAK